MNIPKLVRQKAEEYAASLERHGYNAVTKKLLIEFMQSEQGLAVLEAVAREAFISGVKIQQDEKLHLNSFNHWWQEQGMK